MQNKFYLEGQHHSGGKIPAGRTNHWKHWNKRSRPHTTTYGDVSRALVELPNDQPSSQPILGSYNLQWTYWHPINITLITKCSKLIEKQIKNLFFFFANYLGITYEEVKGKVTLAKSVKSN